MEEQGAFDYQYDCNREVFFVCWNEKTYVITGTSFESLFATVCGWNTELKQKPQCPRHVTPMLEMLIMTAWYGSMLLELRKMWSWALFTQMVENGLSKCMAPLQTCRWGTLGLLYFKHAVAVPSQAMHLPKACGRTFCHQLLVTPEPCLILIFDGTGHTIAKWKEPRKWLCKGKSRYFCTKCNVTLCIQYFLCITSEILCNILNINVLHIMFFASYIL
jgi:hypothetical protein